MTATIETVTLFAPIIASSGIFAARRASKGLDNMDDKPAYGLSNLFIAGGQTLKALRAAKDLSLNATPSAVHSIKSTTIAAKEGANTGNFMKYAHKFLKGTHTVFDFVSKNVNCLICGASVLDVLSSEDKLDEAARQSLILSGMFAGEGAIKALVGMPVTKVAKDGTVETIKRVGLYHKNPFIEKQVNAMKDFCMTKSALKSLPGVAKGCALVGFSIAGSALGAGIGDAILGKKKEKTSKAA